MAMGPTGKRPIVFTRQAAFVDLPLNVPCGQCIGCRLDRSQQWAIRCIHEASQYENNCFITLTYDDEHLPNPATLKIKHFQDFMKRLRKRYVGKNPCDKTREPDAWKAWQLANSIRFYHCGEYGETFGRPHYHACIFNHDFGDKELWKNSNENPLYTSAALGELWPQGFSSLGLVSLQSAAYVARYILKKISGDPAQSHYESICPKTGEISQLAPEYTTMSRRPGLGTTWVAKYRSDVYPHGFVVVAGKKLKPPKFYDANYEITHPDEHRSTKRARILASKKHSADQTPARLKVRETIQKARASRLVRNL